MSISQGRRPFVVRLTAPFMWGLNNAVTSLNALGTLMIIALMALICADVVGRNLLSTSLPGVIELAELGIVSIVFLQIGDTLKNGKLMRSDGLIKVIEARTPRLGYLLNAVFDATGTFIFYYITKGAFNRFVQAWEGDYYLGNQGGFTAPTWPMELIVTLGSGIMCLLFATNALRGLSILFGLLPEVAKPEDSAINTGVADK